MSEQESIIKVKDLSKSFKDLQAVKSVSFKVHKGEVFGFLGPNGAGKTTTISMLATLLKVTGGDAWIAGHSIKNERIQVRKSIGLVFQESTLDEELTAKENLKFHAEFYGMNKKDYEKRSTELLEIVDLAERADDPVRNFSGGMKRRLEIARGILHYPKVLFLDEPTIGLDPQTRAKMWQYILRVAKEQSITLFMTTHYLDESEYCDHIAIMDKGQIVALDTPDKLKEHVGGDVITLKTANNQQVIQGLKNKFQLETKENEGELKIVAKKGDEVLPKILKGLDVNVTSIELKKPTMDDVFIKLTGSTIRDSEVSDTEKTKRFMRRRGRR